jgi:hypothetical protein
MDTDSNQNICFAAYYGAFSIYLSPPHLIIGILEYESGEKRWAKKLSGITEQLLIFQFNSDETKVIAMTRSRSVGADFNIIIINVDDGIIINSFKETTLVLSPASFAYLDHINDSLFILDFNYVSGITHQAMYHFDLQTSPGSVAVPV